MKKSFLIGLAVGSALIVGATGASAETTNVKSAQPVSAAKLANAAPQEEAGAAQADLPDPATPKPKKKRRFFGLPLLGLAAAGGGTGLALSGGNSGAPASP